MYHHRHATCTLYRLFLVLIGEPTAHRRYTYREVAAEEEEEGTTRDVEGTGVGVEVPALMVELQELTLEGHWAFALASKVSDSSYLHLLFDGTLPVGADLDCRHPMMVLAWTTRCGVLACYRYFQPSMRKIFAPAIIAAYIGST